MVKVVQMSLKEADRYAVIQQVIERTMGQSDAALWLNISVRQVKRLARAIRQDGAQGAVSKRWGVPSNRRISQAVRDQFVRLVRDHYSDFGPTLAREYLAAQHGYTGSAETLRTWMIGAGLWKAKRTRVRRIHSPRARRSCAGELDARLRYLSPNGYLNQTAINLIAAYARIYWAAALKYPIRYMPQTNYPSSPRRRGSSCQAKSPQL